MFYIIRLCDVEQQLKFYDIFVSIVSKSTLNQSNCCKAHLPDLLLSLFSTLPRYDIQLANYAQNNDQLSYSDEVKSSDQNAEEKDVLKKRAIQLIEILGTHSISVKQLKKFFALMKTQTINQPVGVIPLCPTPPELPVKVRSPHNAAMLEALERMTNKQGFIDFVSV